MKLVSVYNQAGTAMVCIDDWSEEKDRSKHYQPGQASLDRLTHIVNIWCSEGRMWVRPFLGGCVGYVAVEGEMWTVPQDKREQLVQKTGSDD